MFLKEFCSWQLVFPPLSPTLRNHKVVVRELLHSQQVFLQILCGFRAISPLFVMPPLTRGGRYLFMWAREARAPGKEAALLSAFYCRASRRGLECSLPLALLFGSSPLLIVEWATVTLWSIMRALLLLQEARRVWILTHRIKCCQIWESCQRPSRALTFWAR